MNLGGYSELEEGAGRQSLRDRALTPHLLSTFWDRFPMVMYIGHLWWILGF